MFTGAQNVSLQDTVINAPIINNYNTYISNPEAVRAFLWFMGCISVIDVTYDSLFLLLTLFLNGQIYFLLALRLYCFFHLRESNTSLSL